MNSHPGTDRPVVRAGIFLGIGMGGFLDGILFHQLLQTHSLLSARLPKTTIPNIEVNMFWDGMFHMLTWTMTAIGLALLWRAGAQRNLPWVGRTFTGALLLGWGLFNFVEGLIDHHILHLHHVVERHGVSVYDYAFLGSGVLLGVAGWMLIRSGSRLAAPRPRE